MAAYSLSTFGHFPDSMQWRICSSSSSFVSSFGIIREFGLACVTTNRICSSVSSASSEEGLDRECEYRFDCIFFWQFLNFSFYAFCRSSDQKLIRSAAVLCPFSRSLTGRHVLSFMFADEFFLFTSTSPCLQCNSYKSHRSNLPLFSC